MKSHRLRELTFDTTDPEAMTDLHRALDPVALTVEPEFSQYGQAIQVQLVDGTVIRFRRADVPSRTHLGFGLTDAAGATQRLEELDIYWVLSGPGVIHFRDIDDNHTYLVAENPDAVPDFYRRDQKLIAATLFVDDVPAAARWWRALGLSVGDESNLVGSIPADHDHDDTADVFFDNTILQLWPRGDFAATVAHLVIAGVDLDAAALGLDGIGWEFVRIVDLEIDGKPEELRTMTPDGCVVRLTGSGAPSPAVASE